MPTVSVVLLTNGKPELLREVLEAILAQDHQPLEPIVVLNGLNPAIEAIVAEYPAVRLLTNARDLGFASGMNRGIRESTGDYVYLTANDIVLAPNCIGELVRAAEANPGWGLLGGVWRNYLSASKEVVIAGGSARFGRAGLRSEICTTARDDDRPYDADWLAGASLFTRKAVWDALGGFRDDFFAHFEDIDLCLRARRAGGYVRVVPRALLYHHEHPRGLSQNHRIEYYKLRNYLAVNALHGPLTSLPLVGVKFFAYTAPRIAWYLRSPLFLLRVWWGSLVRLPLWLAQRRQPGRLPAVAAAGVVSVS
jgi:GT2 family glycosyltransferase